VWDGQFEPFGEEFLIAGAAAMPLRFPGQYADDETGLSYNYFRDYDPSLGRFIESDPIGLLGGINTYGYVGGNPWKFTDWRGLSVDPDPSGFFAPWLFGTWVHSRFSNFVNSRGPDYRANINYDNLFGSFRPDAFDRRKLYVWELKPESCKAPGPARQKALNQLQNYVTTAQGTDPDWSVGDSRVLFDKYGEQVFTDNYLGWKVTVRFYPDPVSSSGLIFYEVTKKVSPFEQLAPYLRNMLQGGFSYWPPSDDRRGANSSCGCE